MVFCLFCWIVQQKYTNMLYLLPASLVYTAVHFIKYVLFYSDSVLEILFKFRLTFLKACIIYLTVQDKLFPWLSLLPYFSKKLLFSSDFSSDFVFVIMWLLHGTITAISNITDLDEESILHGKGLSNIKYFCIF